MSWIHIKKNLHGWRGIVRENYLEFAIIAIIFSIFLISGIHEQYPDEYDSLMGGKRILEGSIPYKDWFQHHQPGAYVLAALILPLTGPHFLRFRLVLETVYFLIFLTTYLYIKWRFSKHRAWWFIGFWGVYGLLQTFFWGQMLLADSLSAVVLMPALVILAVLIWEKEQASKNDILLINTSLFLTWFTSMTYVYVIGILTLVTMFISSFGQIGGRNKTLSIVKTGFFMALPYGIFFLFFIVIGGLGDWWFSNVYYNQNYYIYNYPRPVGTPVNPIRYSVVLVNQFIDNYSFALYGVAAFPFSAPINAGLALFAFTYFYVLVSKKKYLFAISFLIACTFAAVRSNPNNIGNTDYQSSVYIMLSLLAGFLALAEIKDRLDYGKSKAFLKITDAALGLLTATYLISVFLFALNEFRGKMYPKYMGTAPLVYDFPQVSPIINSVVNTNEYAWVGPFEFEEIFYLHTKLPSKYHWFLDHAGRIEKIQKEMINDFLANSPEVIVFRREYHPWGGRGSEFNGFFTSYLDKWYMNSAELNRQNETKQYFWKDQFKGYFNLETEFYWKRNNTENMIKKLIEKGWVEVRDKELQKNARI